MATHLALVRADHLLESIEQLSRHKQRLALPWLIAAACHAGFGLALLRAPHALPERPRAAPLMFELEPAREPSPVPEPPADVPRPQDEPARTATPRNALPERRAARAAPVLAQSETPEQAVDFTDAVVTGTATSFAGGTTTSTGTSSSAVRGPAGGGVTRGNPSSTGSGAANIVDLSRPARVTGGLDWKCPFPEQANTDGIDRAVATIRVALDASGRTTSVSIVKDPGHGFGAAARRCALAKRWIAALDPTGAPIATSVTIAVRFVR